MINRVVLVGHLTRDVDLRYTQGGTAIGRFTVAVTRNFKNSQGERDSDFINCTMWRKAAESFANFAHKGTLVGVDGRIQTGSYTNKDGAKVYTTEVVVDEFSLLSPKNKQESAPSQGGGQSSRSDGKHQQPADSGFDSGTPISDDDLPF